MKKILLLGGYGNFGLRIAVALVKANIAIIICGRNENKARHAATTLQQQYPNAQIEISCFDVHHALQDQLRTLKPLVVINTCGPFQNANYHVAQDCIATHTHYIDLSDGRDFVNHITSLHDLATANDLFITSGASTVPAISSAVLEKYKNDFLEIDTLKFGIAPGQKADRGLATTQAILSYVGRKIKPFAGVKNAYGWQDLYRQDYPILKKRWMANCDIPDLDLLPHYYGIKSIQFSAGMENAILHLGIWSMSWLVRIFPFIHLQKFSAFFLKVSNLFNPFGSNDGGMHMIITGTNHNHQPLTKKWFIIAKNGHGPQIPTIPAIVLAKKLYRNALPLRGAMPCVGLVSLEECLEELQEFDVVTYEMD